LDRFGPERVMDTPIAEETIVGISIGAAMEGLRPVAEFQYADFMSSGFDEITTAAARYHYRSGVPLPMDFTIPIGRAEVKRPGSDVSVITYGAMVHRALEAAENLSQRGVSAEVLDLRTIVPLDEEAVLESVAKTARAVVLYEPHRFLGVGAEVAALIAERAFEQLDAPVLRLAPPSVPVPFSPTLEDAYLPQVADIEAAVERLSSW